MRFGPHLVHPILLKLHICVSIEVNILMHIILFILSPQSAEYTSCLEEESCQLIETCGKGYVRAVAMIALDATRKASIGEKEKKKTTKAIRKLPFH